MEGVEQVGMGWRWGESLGGGGRKRLALADLLRVVCCGILANPSADLILFLWRMGQWLCLPWEL